MTSPASTRLLTTPQSQQKRPVTTIIKDDVVKSRPLSTMTTPRTQSKIVVTPAQSKLNKENGLNQSLPISSTLSPRSGSLTKSPLTKLTVSGTNNALIRSPLGNHNANAAIKQPLSTNPVRRVIPVTKTNAVAGVRKIQTKPQSKPQSKPFATQNTLQKEVTVLTSALQLEKEKNAALKAEIDRLKFELTKAKSNQIMSVEEDELLKDLWHPVASWDYYDAVNSHASSASDSEDEEAEEDEQEAADDEVSCDDSINEYVSENDHYADDDGLSDDEYSDDGSEHSFADLAVRSPPRQPEPAIVQRVAPTLVSAAESVDELDEFSNIAHRLSQLRVTPARPQQHDSGIIDISSSPESAHATHSRHLSINPLLLSPVNVNQMFEDNEHTSSDSPIDVSQVEIDSADSSPVHEGSYNQTNHSVNQSINQSIDQSINRSEPLTQSPSRLTQSERDDSETDLSDNESVDEDETVSNMSADDHLSADSATEEEEVEDEEVDDGSSQGFVDVFPYERNLYLLSRHYHLHNRLYSCPDAVTFKATHIQTNQMVVIKISEGYSHSGYQSGALGTHPKEIRLLSSAQGHSNIMEMTGWFGFPATRCYAFITRYIDNVNVESLFESPSLIRLYMRDLLTGIAHLHSRNILYRDLKPSNVLWNSATQKATIIDFDVATYFNRENGHTSQVGTFGYLAPEMDGETRYTLAVDVYAAGIVFGSLLFGFHEDEVADRERHDTKGAAMIDRVLAFSQQFNGRIGADFHLLLRMLTEDPTLRITVEEALQHPYIAQEQY